MRVLCAAPPFVGLLNPMVPLLHACRSQGHEVLVMTSGNAVDLVARAGLPVVDCAPGRDPDAEYAAMERRRGQGPPPADGPRFSFFSEEMADVAMDVARAWRPDVVLQPPLAPFGHLVAAALDVPDVLHTVGFGHGQPQVDLINDAAAPAFRRHRVAGPASPAVTLDVVPPSMVRTELPHRRPMRYVPYNGDARVPDWLLAERGRPRIAVTLGTIQPQIDGLGPLRPVVDAAHRLDAEVVLALGDVDVSELGDLGENVRACGWLPLSQLLAASDAVVHHGGAGTTLTAMHSGLPQIVLGRGADRPANAEAARARGCALVPDEGRPLDAALLDRVLTDTALREAADDVLAEMTRQPTPAARVEVLTSLVGESP